MVFFKTTKSPSKPSPPNSSNNNNNTSSTSTSTNNNNLSSSSSSTTTSNLIQSPPPPPPSSSSLYNSTENIDLGYLANSEPPPARSYKKIQKLNTFNYNNSNTNSNLNNTNMGNEQTGGEKNQKSLPITNIEKNNKARRFDQDEESEVIKQFNPNDFIYSTGRRSSINQDLPVNESLYVNESPMVQYSKTAFIPPQQSTGDHFAADYSSFFKNNKKEQSPMSQYSNAFVPQQQSTGEYSFKSKMGNNTITSKGAIRNNVQQTDKKYVPPPSMMKEEPFKRRRSVASAGSTGSLGYHDDMPEVDDFGKNLTEQSIEQSIEQAERDKVLQKLSQMEELSQKSEKEKPEKKSEKKDKKERTDKKKKKQPIKRTPTKEEVKDEVSESSESEEEVKKPSQKKQETNTIDRYRSFPTFDTAFTTTRIYFKYGEYNLPAVISDQSNLIQIINEIKLKFKQLQNENEIEISYDNNDIKNILVMDDESVLEMIQYFKTIDSPFLRIIKINLNNNLNQNNLNNNQLNNLNNLNNQNQLNEIIYKFSVEYITSILEKANKNLVLKINYSEPLQKFINDIADKCSLPNGSGLYIIQFYDKAFNDYIDINDLNEMDLDKNGINLIKIKKSTRNNITSNNSQSGNSYSNAFIGLIINDKYIITDSLGRGGQGCVFSCQDLKSKKDYAIKFIISNGEIQQEEQAKKEAIFMELLQHENIARVEGVFTWKEILENSPDFNYNMLFTPLLCILMERYFYGNIMQSVIIEKGLKLALPLNLFLIFKIIYQTSKALAFIHEKQIIHRDIKPHNILIKSFDFEKNDINIVISDFGTAKDDIHTTHHTHIGTLLFESPEVMLHRSYGLSADLYSLGVTLFQLLSLNINFNSTFKLIQSEKDCFNEMDELILKNYQFYNFNQNEKEILNSLMEILHKLMKLSPQDRLTAKELVEQLDILDLEYLN